jgi:uracil phosphoribosyltransferase
MEYAVYTAWAGNRCGSADWLLLLLLLRHHRRSFVRLRSLGTSLLHLLLYWALRVLSFLKMTTLIPRGPYTQDEIEKLYPKELKLQLVQVVRADLSFWKWPNRGLAANFPPSFYGMVQMKLSTANLHKSSH